MNKFGSLYDEAAGRRSRSALVAMGAFWAGLAKFLLSGAEIKVNDFVVHLAPVDATLLGVFMGTCFALYWGRRYTDTLHPRMPEPPVEPPMPAPPGTGAVG